jgi:hypothetical protein
VRQLLATDGATLAVSGPASTGAIVARLWRTNWQDYPVVLGIGDGEVALSADAAGDLVVEDLGFALAPIELSDQIFDEPTALVDLRVDLAADAAPAPTTWADADTATAAAAVTFRLSWALSVGDRVTPLGPVTLTQLPLALSVGGDAAHVDAGLELHADGVVWQWADLIELADLSLSIAAASTDE